MHEKIEKKKTIYVFRSPFTDSFLTIVYAAPAPIPPKSPIILAGFIRPCVGLIINKLPKNAIITVNNWNKLIFFP